MSGFLGSDCLQPENTFFKGYGQYLWSLEVVCFSISTCKIQKIEEVSIFVTPKNKVLHFKCIQINFENQPYL